MFLKFENKETTNILKFIHILNSTVKTQEGETPGKQRAKSVLTQYCWMILMTASTCWCPSLRRKALARP